MGLEEKPESIKVIKIVIFFWFWWCRCNQWNEGFDFCIDLDKWFITSISASHLSQRSLQHSSSVSTECSKQAIVKVQDAVYEGFANYTLTSKSLILLCFQLDFRSFVRFSVYKIDI